MLNRSAVLVRPKQPYLEWASGFDEGSDSIDHDAERTIYLLPEYGDEDEAIALLKEGFDTIFDAELYAWHTDEDDWPAERTYELFIAWFDVEFHSIVADLCAYPIEDDEPVEEGS